MAKTFSDVATELAGKFGEMIPHSVLHNTCARENVKVPNDLNFVRTGKRGGRLDVSKYLNAGAAIAPSPYAPEGIREEDEEDLLSTEDRFSALDVMAHGIVDGHFHALIVSGNPGIGKTFTLELILAQGQKDGKIEKYVPVHGYSRATGIFRLLYQNREEGQVVLFDDCDSVFGDEISLNILKAALDTTHTRIVSWHSEKNFEDEDGNFLPKSFEYNGTVVFVTNLDFEKNKGGKNGTHLDALMSRSYYLNLNMRNEVELMNRIETVTKSSTLLTDAGVNKAEAAPFILKYIRDNQRNLRELSLRCVVKLAKIYKASTDEASFYVMADAAVCKRATKRK